MRTPEPFWAVALAVLGVTLALAVLFHPEPEFIGNAVLAIASNLVAGALGAFAGRASKPDNAIFPDGTTSTK